MAYQRSTEGIQVPATIQTEVYPNRPSDALPQIATIVHKEWLAPRPAIVALDSVLVSTFKHVLSELDEVLAELDSSELNLHELLKEVIDIYVLLLSTGYARLATPDLADLNARTNGQAKNADVFDLRFRSLLDSIDLDELDQKPEKLKQVLHELLILVGSFLNHGPLSHLSAREVKDGARSVQSKNENNYFYPYLSDVDFYTGRVLRQDEQIKRALHVIQCLKTIRADVTARHGEKKDGLDHTDHHPYRLLIHDWEHSQEALRQLKEILSGKQLIKNGVVRPDYREIPPRAQLAQPMREGVVVHIGRSQ